MEYFAEIVHIVGERLIDFQANRPANKHSAEIYRKNFSILQVIFFIITIALASLLPASLVFSSFRDGDVSTTYLEIATILIFATIITSLFVFPKILLLTRRLSGEQIIQESISIEDDIKYELGIEFLSFILTFIPFGYIIFCPLTIDRAINIIEITNSSRQKFRKLAANIAGYSVVVFMANSFITTITLLIMGNTRW